MLKSINDENDHLLFIYFLIIFWQSKILDQNLARFWNFIQRNYLKSTKEKNVCCPQYIGFDSKGRFIQISMNQISIYK